MTSRDRRTSKGKKINPKFWVFCEGKTEKAYVEYLRTTYRIPIKIIPKVIGSKINRSLISKHIFKKETHKKDKIFLLYDADVQTIIERLNQIDGAILLLSNPSIELWFLLHYKNQTGNITSEECIKQLSNRNRIKYKKAYIDDRLKTKLETNQRKAVDRASRLSLYHNPSTGVYKLIDILNQIKPR